MKKYHINPDTGRANLCHADPSNPKGRGCDFAVDGVVPEHFASKDEAKASYEKSMKAEELVSLTRKVETEKPGLTYVFEPQRLEQAMHLIDKANRKLERAGIEERFEYITNHRLIVKKDENGMPVAREVIDFTVNKPTIGIEGSKFLAVVVQEDAGMIVKSARDVELSGWTPDKLVCDKCGQARSREKTYIIEDKDGNRMQVGSSCVKGYLGISPSGLWALEFELPDDYNAEDSDFDSIAPVSSRDMSRPVDNMLALAIAVQEDSGEFVSSRFADMSGKDSTAQLVQKAIYGGKNVDTEWRESILQRAQELELDKSRIKQIKESITEMEEGSDYANNLKTLSKGEWVSSKNHNLLVSALSVLDRKEREAKKKKENAIMYSPGFTAPVDAKIKGLKATIMSSKIINGYDYRGEPISKTQITFRDHDGHQMVWFASKIIDGFENGDEISFTGGSVKKHGSYNDIDQTLLTRVKFENIVKED